MFHPRRHKQRRLASRRPSPQLRSARGRPGGTRSKEPSCDWEMHRTRGQKQGKIGARAAERRSQRRHSGIAGILMEFEDACFKLRRKLSKPSKPWKMLKVPHVSILITIGNKLMRALTRRKQDIMGCDGGTMPDCDVCCHILYNFGIVLLGIQSIVGGCGGYFS